MKKFVEYRESLAIMSMIILIMSCQNFMPDNAGIKEYVFYIVLGIIFLFYSMEDYQAKRKNLLKYQKLNILVA